ncbi:MAG: TetR/AcrR family transcriptional regulator [Candidatus Cloacimonetes bacterium]|nr:TetR/AcrR family transcriptional regulator [Candidatus Cloacimonadota bacterium]
MNKKESIANFNKETILKAAKELFLEYGMSETTMDMIAKKSDYSKATIYSYLKSKEEIFYYLVLSYMVSFRNDVNSIVNDLSSLKDKYFYICYKLVDFQKESNIFFQGMIGFINMDIDNPDTLTVYKEIYKEGILINNIFAKLLYQAIEEKYIKESENISSIILYLWSGISGIVNMSSQKKDYIKLLGLEQDKFLKYALECLLKGIIEK